MAWIAGVKDLKLLHSPTTAIRSLDWGLASDTKDFLDPSKTKGSVITRKTGQRKRTVNIYLYKLPHELQDAIKKDIYLYLVIYLLHQISCCVCLIMA